MEIELPSHVGCLLGRVLLCGTFFLTMRFATAQNPTVHDAEVYDNYAEHSGGGRGASQVTISPDGKTVGWVGPALDGRQMGIWIMPVAGGTASQIKGAGQESDMAWSPDGASIAFVSGRGGRGQIYVAPAAGGEARKLTSFTGQIGQPVWSPDGKSLAFLGIENPKRVSGATQPFKPETGVIGSKPDVQRLAIIDVATGQLHWGSPETMYVYEFGWAPSSQEVAVTAA